MSAELSMNGRKKIETIQKEFTDKFNYLTLLFLDENRKSLDISCTLAEVMAIKGTELSINAGLKVNTLEARFMQNYGLLVEVAYKKNGKVMHTKESVVKTLNELNRWCSENGCDKFEFKKSLKGNTVQSLQENLFESISEIYPDAVAKKINKDNFMDVHLPSVNSKRGTHLFFNTAKDGIKLGFYCRDEQFNNPILERSSIIEAYAQGIRLRGNPSFTNKDEAIQAALEFIGEIMGEPEIDSKRINLYLENEMESVRPETEDIDNLEELLEKYGVESVKELSSITPELASELIKYEDADSFDGLKTISDECLEIISNHPSSLLSLCGLETLSDNGFKILAKYKGFLYLDGIKKLSDEAAFNISKHDGGLLSLVGLEVLSDKAFQNLAKYDGMLMLNGIKSLTDSAADALSEHRSFLSLNGIENLTDNAAIALSRHEGDLFLNGLLSLSEVAAEALAAKGITVNNISDSFDNIGNDETDDLSELILNELPSKKPDIKYYEVNGKYTFTLGYDGKSYMNEDVIGIVPDSYIIDALDSGLNWSEFIWDNGWSELDSKIHNHGIIEPATHLELPSGERHNVVIKYRTPEFDKQEVAFSNTSGEFVHISSSSEKAYGWDDWKKYRLNFGPGVFDTSKIRVIFSDDIVAGYFYELSKDEIVEFSEDNNYQTSGVGFYSSLHFNNGKELLFIDLEELSAELAEHNIDKNDVDAIKEYLMNKDSL